MMSENVCHIHVFIKHTPIHTDKLAVLDNYSEIQTRRHNVSNNETQQCSGCMTGINTVTLNNTFEHAQNLEIIFGETRMPDYICISRTERMTKQ